MYKEQQFFSGYDSYLNLDKVLKDLNAKKPFLVVDSAYDFLFIKDYIAGLNYDFVFFNDFKPNPLYDDVVKGVDLFNSEKCDVIVSIGGGSAIDTAKCIKLYALMDKSEVYLKQEYKDTGIMHLAIPTTAGTGSESTRFAVCYYEGAKQSVTHESIIPDYVILEPKFLETLPEYQKKSTLLDALCQGIESLWSVNSTEESSCYATKAITTILANMEKYLKGEKDALARISVGANYAGKAINISQTTAAHAMSYKITSLYGLAHGHAVAVCLPYVLDYMIDNVDKCIDPRGVAHLEEIFDRLKELFYVDSMKDVVDRFFGILDYMGMDFPKLGSEEDMKVLISSVNPVRLKNNPVGLSEEAIGEIYNRIFTEGNLKKKI